MRVLFVDQTGQLGGGELSLLDIIRRTSHAAEVVLFSDGPFRKLLEDIPVPVHVLSAGAAGEVRREAGWTSIFSAAPALFKLRNELAQKSRGFDVIYANSQKAFLLSALVKRPGQRLIWHLRDMLQADHFSSILRNIAVFTGNRAANLIIANSQATLDSLVASGGRRDKAVVIYNGISSQPFDEVTNETIERLRAELGWQDRFVVGAFGRLAPWKGQNILIEAVKDLPEVHVAIVGDALFGEQEYANSLRALVLQNKMEHRVHFLGFRRDIPELMRSVDIVAHTATAPEPFGRVIVEGMLAGRPVIATRAGGALEIVRNGDNGLLVPPGDPRTLGEAITQLRTSPNLLDEIVDRGRKSALKSFSVEKMSTEIDLAVSSPLQLL